MLHHVSVGVRDVAQAGDFYDAVLSALGYKRVMEYLPHGIAYGETKPVFWIQLPRGQQELTVANGGHIALEAASKEAIQAFYDTALAKGAIDDGAPGPRPDYSPCHRSGRQPSGSGADGQACGGEEADRQDREGQKSQETGRQGRSGEKSRPKSEKSGQAHQKGCSQGKESGKARQKNCPQGKESGQARTQNQEKGRKKRQEEMKSGGHGCALWPPHLSRRRGGSQGTRMPPPGD